MATIETPWIVEDLNEVVGKEFDDLPVDIQAKFLHLITLIEEDGLVTLREPYIKHLQGKLWEMRVKAKAGQGRGLYFTVTGRRVVVLRYFIKKADKTPKREMDLALKRMEAMEEQRHD